MFYSTSYSVKNYYLAILFILVFNAKRYDRCYHIVDHGAPLLKILSKFKNNYWLIFVLDLMEIYLYRYENRWLPLLDKISANSFEDLNFLPPLVPMR
jgi:hypothetical protein